MKYDVAIVGAGIAGLSLAWTLSRAGQRVVVLEKSARAQGASVRNFGMVWPVGHPLGETRDLALRSRELWLTMAQETGVWVDPRGSLTLVYEEPEEQVLREFMDQAGRDPSVGRLVDPGEASMISPKIRTKGLRLALHSPTELCVDPRKTVHLLAAHLLKNGVDIRFSTPVSRVGSGGLLLAEGGSVKADKIVVAAGPDLRDILPDVGPRDGLKRCALQMLRLAPMRRPWPDMAVHLCAGLTLGHYANFSQCPSLPALKEFHARKWPAQVDNGIHVLVSQHADGSLTVGDSHSYGDETSPYLSDVVERLILSALDEFLDVSDFAVAQRWYGYYNTAPGRFYSWCQVQPGVWSINLFGTGMSLSFGIAELVTRSALA